MPKTTPTLANDMDGYKDWFSQGLAQYQWDNLL